MAFVDMTDAGIVIKNGVKFHVGCCECGLVHDVLVRSTKLPAGADMLIFMERDKRATTYRRKALKKDRAKAKAK